MKGYLNLVILLEGLNEIPRTPLEQNSGWSANSRV
jgi:hypothetical protein